MYKQKRSKPPQPFSCYPFLLRLHRDVVFDLNHTPLFFGSSPPVSAVSVVSDPPVSPVSTGSTPPVSAVSQGQMARALDLVDSEKREIVFDG